jgi:hypothetical protein
MASQVRRTGCGEIPINFACPSDPALETDISGHPLCLDTVWETSYNICIAAGWLKSLFQLLDTCTESLILAPHPLELESLASEIPVLGCCLCREALLVGRLCVGRTSKGGSLKGNSCW